MQTDGQTSLDSRSVQLSTFPWQHTNIWVSSTAGL